MKKYLFLDIDGVLNHYNWYEYRHDNLGTFNFEGLNWVKSEADPECVERVWRILGERGEEIKKYLDEHEPGNYAILDDDIDMREDQMDHFVNTDFMDGLTDELADKVIEILNKEE